MADEDLAELKYGGSYVLPDRDSYVFNEPYGVRSSSVAGTLNRISRGIIGGPFSLTVTIQLNSPSMLVWWDDFYNFTITEGSKRFKMMLLLNGIIQEHVVQITAVPQVSTPGWKGTVQLKLQAVPAPMDRCAAASRQLIMQCQGDYSACYLQSITDLGLLLNEAW